MEPTKDELAAISTIDEAYDWAGVPPDVRDSLAKVMGTPQKIRDIAFINRATWDSLSVKVKGSGPAPQGGGDPPERDLTAVEVGRLEMFRKVCLLRLGGTPDGPGDAVPTPKVAPSGPILGPGSSPSRKLKLSAVVDQTLDAEVQMLKVTEVQDLFERYKQKFGDNPLPEAEPTADQLSAVKQILDSGAPPYIDYGVYGPNGLRLLRKQTFASYSMGSDGTWQKKELPGPPDLDSWRKVHRVVRTTFLLLEAISAERLDGYSEFIGSLAARFGPTCWDIIYTADVHMRSEQFERIRRRLQEKPDHGYTESSPWNAVYAQAIREDSFWSQEVITPCTLRLAQSKTVPGTSSSAAPAPPKRENTEGGKAPKKKRKVAATDDQSKFDGKIYTHNKRGVEVCMAWNSSKCGSSNKPQSKCENSRSHQCNQCLGPHQGKDCTKPKWPSQSRKAVVAAQQPSENHESAASGSKANRDRSPLQRKRGPEPSGSDDTPGLVAKALPKPPDKASSAKKQRTEPSQSSQLGKGQKGPYYGYWTHKTSDVVQKPRCLHLFSGPPREGDLAQQLASLGWATCSCDILQTSPTNLLDQGVRSRIIQDVRDGIYDHIFLGTPCETFSALREIQPGPRPLRSETELTGITSGLSAGEKKQVTEANEHTSFSATVMTQALVDEVGFTMENPEPLKPVTIFEMREIKEVSAAEEVKDTNFDQCRFGGENAKPTRLLHYKVDYTSLEEVRCNHPKQEFTDAKGNKYKAAHERVAQRKRTTSEGKEEFASKALGQYPAILCKELAKCIAETNSTRAKRARESRKEVPAWPSYKGPGDQPREKEVEEEAALGGMRNPKRSCEKLPEAKSTGEFVRDLLDHTVSVYPDLLETAHDILSGAEQVREIEGHNYDVVKAAVMKLLETEVPLPAKTARASSPLNAQAIWDWGHLTDDPDATTLAEWIQQGAPLGFDEPIACNGVFPKVSGTPADLPSDAEIRRPSEGWQNWPSADEEIADLRELVKDAEKKGFCEVTQDEEEAVKILGDKPVLNKLGVVVKFSGQTKKSRIIWDLRESGVNLRCDTAERIVLPRLLDVVQETLEAIRNDQEPIFAAIDIRDAFHNVPAGKDRKYTVARADDKFIIYNVLVFGSRSSPTIWGRFAAFIGRTLLCIVPELGCQIYVDDPIFVIPGKGENAARFLTLALLVFKIFGFPVKLAKASAGQVVKWIGAELSITQDPDGPLVMVKIPEEKVEKLLQEVDNLLPQGPSCGNTTTQVVCRGHGICRRAGSDFETLFSATLGCPIQGFNEWRWGIFYLEWKTPDWKVDPCEKDCHKFSVDWGALTKSTWKPG